MNYFIFKYKFNFSLFYYMNKISLLDKIRSILDKSISTKKKFKSTSSKSLTFRYKNKSSKNKSLLVSNRKKTKTHKKKLITNSQKKHRERHFPTPIKPKKCFFRICEQF